MDFDRYIEIIRDIEIAQDELIKMKLYPQNIIADFYCIPSFCHQTYYAILSKRGSVFELTYLVPHIYGIKDNNEPIKTCSFATCKEAETHHPLKGKYIMGIKTVPPDSLERLLKCLAFIPNQYVFEKSFLRIDGVLQGIRLWGTAKKEVFYYDAAEIIGLSPEQVNYLNDLYLKMEKILEKQDDL